MDTNLFIQALKQYRPLTTNVTIIDDGVLKDSYQLIKEAALSCGLDGVRESLQALNSGMIIELSDADIEVIVSIYNQLEKERRKLEEVLHKRMNRKLLMEALNHHRISINSDIMDDDEDQSMRMTNSMLKRDISMHKCLRDLLIDYNHKHILRLSDDDIDGIIDEYNLLINLNNKYKNNKI